MSHIMITVVNYSAMPDSFKHQKSRRNIEQHNVQFGVSNILREISFNHMKNRYSVRYTHQIQGILVTKDHQMSIRLYYVQKVKAYRLNSALETPMQVCEKMEIKILRRDLPQAEARQQWRVTTRQAPLKQCELKGNIKTISEQSGDMHLTVEKFPQNTSGTIPHHADEQERQQHDVGRECGEDIEPLLNGA